MDHLLLRRFIPNVMLQFMTNIISFLQKVRDSWGMFWLEIEGKYVFFKNDNYKMHRIQWSIRNCSLLGTGQDDKTLRYYKEKLIIKRYHFCLQWIVHPTWEASCEREGIYTNEHIWTKCWLSYFGVRGGRLPFKTSPVWVPRPKPGPVVHKDPVTWVKTSGAGPHPSCILWEWQAGVTLVPSWYQAPPVLFWLQRLSPTLLLTDWSISLWVKFWP